MNLKIFKEPTMHQNVYLYYDDEMKKGAVIDAGGGGTQALRFIEEAGIEIQMILLTHAHFDHITTLEEIRGATGAPVFVHKEEVPILQDSHLNYSAAAFRRPLTFVADRLLEDGELLSVGSHDLRVLHTPGHSPGSACYYDQQEGIVFTGDTLFYHSIGRGDLLLADNSAVVPSIREKLFTLPEEVKVYPGHMKATSIGHEQEHNPFMENERG